VTLIGTRSGLKWEFWFEVQQDLIYAFYLVESR